MWRRICGGEFTETEWEGGKEEKKAVSQNVECNVHVDTVCTYIKSISERMRWNIRAERHCLPIIRQFRVLIAKNACVLTESLSRRMWWLLGWWQKQCLESGAAMRRVRVLCDRELAFTLCSMPPLSISNSYLASRDIPLISASNEWSQIALLCTRVYPEVSGLAAWS